jgi:hypothetical protein
VLQDSKILRKPRALKQGTESQPAAATHMDEVDVAIFGAGPAGLSTALGLCKACPDLKVRSAFNIATCAYLQHAQLGRTEKHLVGEMQKSSFITVITNCLCDKIK